jgi:GNAT superfamily N-acetyltransferase
MDEFLLTVFDTDDAHRTEVLRALAAHMAATHRWNTGAFRPLFVSLREPDGSVRGGLLATTHGEWLEVEFVWVAESLRRQGFGTRMLAAAEVEAAARGCQRGYLDTGCSTSNAFFGHCGYLVVGELTNYDNGQPRYWMSKSLT